MANSLNEGFFFWIYLYLLNVYWNYSIDESIMFVVYTFYWFCMMKEISTESISSFTGIICLSKEIFKNWSQHFTPQSEYSDVTLKLFKCRSLLLYESMVGAVCTRIEEWMKCTANVLYKSHLLSKTWPHFRQ